MLQRLERRKAMETRSGQFGCPKCLSVAAVGTPKGNGDAQCPWCCWSACRVAAVGTPKGNGESPACVVPSAFSMLQRLERRKAMETSLFRMAATRKFRSGTRLKPKGNGDARSAACFCISAASSGTRLEPKGNGDRSRKTDTDNPSYGRERS